MKTITKDMFPIVRKGEFILPILLILGFLYLITKAKASFFPIILSTALAYLLHPLVSHFEMKGFKRIHIVAALYLVAGVVIFFAGKSLSFALTEQISKLKIQWPQYLEQFQTTYLNFEEKIVTLFPFSETYLSWETISPKVLVLGEKIPNLVIGAIPAITLFFLVPFFTFFLLIDGKRIVNAFLDMLPSKTVETSLYIFSQTDESLGNYIRGILLEATSLFVLAFIGLSFMKLEYAGAVALVIGVTSLVPYLGVIVGAIVSLVAAYVQFGTIMAVIKILLFFAFLKVIDDAFLVPNILKRAVKIHPIVIVFALTAGGELFGLWGVVFAMPVTCMIKVILSIAIELHRSAFNWKPKLQPARISIPYV
ncbi:MAG TPA: AI-2E family transporter [Elusimicrobiales bacterium]|nr:AI-2E family transporter [Elusimicrobiales bacterium]